MLYLVICSKRAKSLQTHQSRLLILEHYFPYLIFPLHLNLCIIPLPHFLQLNPFSIVQMQEEMQNKPVFLLWDCVTKAEKSSLELYTVSSALLTLILTDTFLYRREQRCKAPAHSKYVWGGGRKNKMGILAYNKHYGL